MARLSRNARTALALIARAGRAFTAGETWEESGTRRDPRTTAWVHWRTARVLRDRGLVELTYAYAEDTGTRTYRVDAIALTPAGHRRAGDISDGGEDR